MLQIQGAGGGLGHLGILYGKALGAKIIAVDSGAKETFCKELGVDAFIDFTKFSNDADLTAEVKRIAPGGVKTVLACTSSNKSYGQAVGFLGFRGTLVCIGVPEGQLQPIAGAIVGAMIGLELTIFGMKASERVKLLKLTSFCSIENR
jgi:alcohol dehydrogenase, propanol-preferring